jgi:hypothetical protein
MALKSISLCFSLAKDLIYANPLRPEPWTATALYLDAKGNKDKAISFTEKVACSELGSPLLTCLGGAAE